MMSFRDSTFSHIERSYHRAMETGDGIVNHSITSGVPERAPYEMINQFFHVFFSKSNIAPPTHENS